MNVHQVAITSVSIAVFARSAHEPQFPSPLYEGIVTELGMMAKNKNDMGQVLRILATDADYGEVKSLLKTFCLLSVFTGQCQTTLWFHHFDMPLLMSCTKTLIFFMSDGH